jgi:hypothetical protein
VLAPDHALLADLRPDQFGYRVLLLAHLVFVIVGFGSTFIWPVLGREADKRGGPAGLALSEVATRYSRYFTVYAIYAAGVFGLVLAIAGGRMDEMWVQAAMGVYVVAIVFSGLVHVPNLNRIDGLAHELAGGATGGPAGAPPPQVAEMGTRMKAAARNTGILHLAFAVLLILMIWQPS